MIDFGVCLTTMRSRAPLVQNITNYVSMNIMANVLLASGASPAMVHAQEEAAQFARIAQALTINIGTLSAPWAMAMKAAIEVANENDTPWIFDPVAAGATTYRQETSAIFLGLRPTIIKGNASEILALTGQSAQGKGADAADSVDTAEVAAISLAKGQGAVVAVTGPVDFVTDGETSYRIANGDALMPCVTALGCSLGGLIAAFSADHPPLEATVSALAYFGLAGEIAAQKAQGPGSFEVHFLDALFNIDAQELNLGAKVQVA